jgi:hypothetical protein
MLLHKLTYRTRTFNRVNSFTMEEDMLPGEPTARLYLSAEIQLNEVSRVVSVRFQVVPQSRDLVAPVGYPVLSRDSAETWLVSSGIIHADLPRLRLVLVQVPEWEAWVRKLDTRTLVA